MSDQTPTPEQERDLLLSYLDAQRQHILGALDDLDDAALRRAVLPSGWSLIAMVQHLALDVERVWFRAVVAGEPDAIEHTLRSGDAAWTVAEELSVDDVLGLYRSEVRRSNDILRRTALDAPPRWLPEEVFGGLQMADVREAILHVMVETACHAGHLDAARELIDGRTWLVLTDEAT